MSSRVVPLAGLTLILAVSLRPVAVEGTIEGVEEWRLDRPALPGTLRVGLRERLERDGDVRVIERVEDWRASETASIVIDMWDDIYCKASARRIGVLVPRMNAILSDARDRGVLVLHAPSGTMDQYAGTLQRLRLERTPVVPPPTPIAAWCDLDPDREPPLPLETKISPCDDPVTGPLVRRYTREHPGLTIDGFDGVSDDGKEIHSYLRRLGIRNVVVMGVHTNMCMLGRSFGIRQLVRLGFKLALARDLTDAMYDPRQPPHVSHARGTELVIEHIERYWCPSLLGADLTRVVPGSDGPRPARERLEQ
jgi:nicotinamidase-related amidase